MAKTQALWQEAKVADLIEKMLSGEIVEIKPTLSLSTESGFSFPDIEKLLEATPETIAQTLENLADEGILTKRFSDKVLLCPYCQSPNLRPSLRCPKCGSGYLDKGRILEHLACGYTGAESEFVSVGKYVCPRCKRELRFLGTDYRSLGIKYVCGNCTEIFTDAMFKWQCLSCLLLFAEHEAKEIPLYTYYLNEDRRLWLGFELKPKSKFIAFMESLGYEVTGKASLTGRSGAEHTFEIVARRNDGLCTHILGVDTIITEPNREVSLGEVFSFDDKAYDAGIHDKVLIVSTGICAEASRFAERQRIKVLTISDLEVLLNSKRALTRKRIDAQPFKFENKAQLIQKLRDLGYNVKEKAKVWGRSSIGYILDVFAEWDDNIIKHSIAVGILTAATEVSLEEVALFDAKAYDVGIHEKILLVAPKMSKEAAQLAQRQRIKVFEVEDAAKLT